MASKYWEDFKVGEEVVSSSITITETHLVNYGCLTMNFHPIHMDEEYAKKTIFKGRLVHGPLIFSMATGLMYMTGFSGDSMLAWLGVENLKVPAPVRIGDTIRVYAKVAEKRETKNPSRGIIKFFWDIKNQRDETVMTLDYILMIHRKA